jgi:hypothetical protein
MYVDNISATTRLKQTHAFDVLPIDLFFLSFFTWFHLVERTDQTEMQSDNLSPRLSDRLFELDRSRDDPMTLLNACHCMDAAARSMPFLKSDQSDRLDNLSVEFTCHTSEIKSPRVTDWNTIHVRNTCTTDLSDTTVRDRFDNIDVNSLAMYSERASSETILGSVTDLSTVEQGSSLLLNDGTNDSNHRLLSRLSMVSLDVMLPTACMFFNLEMFVDNYRRKNARTIVYSMIEPEMPSVTANELNTLQRYANAQEKRTR